MNIASNTFLNVIVAAGTLIGQSYFSQIKANSSLNLLHTLSFPSTECALTLGNHEIQDDTLEELSPKLPDLLANTLLTFFDTEVKAFTLDQKSKERLKNEFKTYFSQHQVFEIKNGKICIMIDDHLAEETYQHFFPLMMDLLKDNTNRFKWVLIEIFMGTSPQKWSDVKKDFATKNLNESKDSFIDDFGGVFKAINRAIAQQYDVKMVTI
ncbi:MAG: hypothetical protein LBG59_09870 [Candidatus Peribacteria bacterium]|nr:hypothetical protein [Candidatus Peribacteria bacterium]